MFGEIRWGDLRGFRVPIELTAAPDNAQLALAAPVQRVAAVSALRGVLFSH